MHCEPALLCDVCLERELVRLRPIAETRSTRLAETLASAIVPDREWLTLIHAHADVIQRLILDLAPDARLRHELARIAAVLTRQRLEYLSRR